MKLMVKLGPTGRFAPDFGDIRKLIVTKLCDISLHKCTKRGRFMSLAYIITARVLRFTLKV